MTTTLNTACPLLEEVVTSRQSYRADGSRAPLERGIKRHLADALYRTILAERPRVVIEVGMCHGISSLTILAALQAAWGDGGEGRLISIDPRQGEAYGHIGVEHVRRAGFAGRHTLLEEPDWQALPRLVSEGQRADLVYIDGNHAMDYTLLDAFYAHRMLPVGGIMTFNDCSMRSVHMVIRWLQSHRAYEEIDAGLPPEWGNDPLTWIAHRLSGRNSADRYFRKRSDAERGYDGHLRW